MSAIRSLWVLSMVLVLSLPTAVRAGAVEDELSQQEMKAFAEKAVEEMRLRRDQAESALRAARADQHMARLDCVNEALIALKGVLKLAEDYLYDLQAEYKQGNAKAVGDSFTKIKLAKKKIDDLDARVRSCGGPSEEGVVEGEPVIERQLDADLPSQDPLEGLESDAIFVERPGTASPYH